MDLRVGTRLSMWISIGISSGISSGISTGISTGIYTWNLHDSSDSDRNRSHSLEEFFHGPNEVPEDAQQAVLQPLTRKSGFFCHDDTNEDASSTDESPYKPNSAAQEQGFSPLSLE